MALSRLQEQVAAMVAALPESDGFVLAGGAAMAAHGLLDRTTRDLDFFGGPKDAAAVQQLADAVERAAASRGLQTQRDREGPAFVRFAISDRDQHEETELGLGIDYRALAPAHTRYGPALDLRELGANKVLAIFDRSEPRDFIDLAALTDRFDLEDLIDLAREKDPGLDLEVLDAFIARVTRCRVPISITTTALMGSCSEESMTGGQRSTISTTESRPTRATFAPTTPTSGSTFSPNAVADETTAPGNGTCPEAESCSG